MNYSKHEKEPAGQGQAFQVGRGEQRPRGGGKELAGQGSQEDPCGCSMACEMEEEVPDQQCQRLMNRWSTASARS